MRLSNLSSVCLLNQGMDIIETLNPAMFTEYLKKYGNTICGRHPIGVLLQVENTKSLNHFDY